MNPLLDIFNFSWFFIETKNTIVLYKQFFMNYIWFLILKTLIWDAMQIKMPQMFYEIERKARFRFISSKCFVIGKWRTEMSQQKISTLEYFSWTRCSRGKGNKKKADFRRRNTNGRVRPVKFSSVMPCKLMNNRANGMRAETHEPRLSPKIAARARIRHSAAMTATRVAGLITSNNSSYFWITAVLWTMSFYRRQRR